MSIVVTGAAGFIARHVVTALVARGHDVIGVDRRRWQPGSGETALVADVSAPTDAVRAALAEADAVVHLAGCPGVRDRRPDVEARRHRDNVVAGARVLDLTPPATPIVVASSSSVYGGSRDGRASHEDDPRSPRGGYARSKARLEDLCARRRSRGGHVAVVRPFTVAGDGQRSDMAIARWLEAARTGAPVTVIGGLDRVRDITDVADVALGIVRTAEVGAATTINLGTGRTHRLEDLVATVSAVTRRPLDVQVVPASDDEVPATRADTRRCARVLGFVPTTDIHRLVARQDAAARAALDTRHLEVV